MKGEAKPLVKFLEGADKLKKIFEECNIDKELLLFEVNLQNSTKQPSNLE